MNTVCPVCGCKTDDFDVEEFVFEDGHTEKLCGYCRKQLKVLEASNTANDMQTRAAVEWLDSMAQRPVDSRSTQCLAQLNRIRKLYPQIPVKRAQAPAAQPSASAQKNVPESAAETHNVPAGEPDERMAVLEKRITALEKDLKGFKRRLLISKIISFAAPLLITLILFIILMASGVLDPLFSYFNTISDLAGQM
ncbi:MAG: hypothetical protein GX051_03200 [Clostridiales bacterium]|nr:hypothetical protein [Clostridiales bacterium]